VAPPVRILGAGPAGLAAAITLARAGRPVEVLERAEACGSRFGGDLQGLENWTERRDVLAELAQGGIAADFACTSFRRAVHSNGRRDMQLSYRRPIFYLVKRGTAGDTLDQALARQAVAAGATIRFGTSCAPAEADIVATGPDPRRTFAVASGIVFDTDSPDLAVVLTNERVAVRGYSYVLVMGGYGCLCSVLFDRFHEARACLERARETLTSRFGVHISNPRPVGGLGHVAMKTTFRHGTTSYVGEAAGLQDMLWGFGMRIAMASGRLAARCLIEGTDYEAAAHAAFDRRIKAGVVNRWLWETLRFADYTVPLHLLALGKRLLLRAMYTYHPLFRPLYGPARVALGRREWAGAGGQGRA
jgi:flavin-dependent dehydrogenase